MSITFEHFLDQFREIQADLIRDHKPDDGTPVGPCNMMHRDLQLEETLRENADELIEKVRETTGQTLPADSVELTEEHNKLHHLLSGVEVEALRAGFGGDQLIAAIFTIGRRYGMREAAEMLGSFGDEVIG